MGRIITVDQLVRHLGIGRDNIARVDSEVVETVIASAEQTVYMESGRHFYPEPALDANDEDTGPEVTKNFRMRRQGQRSVRLPDLREASAVTLDGAELTEGLDYDFDMTGDEPFQTLTLYWTSPHLAAWAPLSFVMTLEITGRWGWLPAPDDIVEVTLQIAARKYWKKDAQFADQVEVSTTTGGNARDYRTGLTTEQIETLHRYRSVRVAMV